MTSRRPMTRSFSASSRTSSFSEEEGSSTNGRSESRNTYLSNVRPENSYSRYSHYRPTRSTLCSVMAQLTEDIQPTFEKTLKSKAVSENCNVKFTCVVSGYPAPELKWYKDDKEMDRYCGLPKYEIHRNGKTHTLHIYNCTLDDAAIYQASASNSKGIVSCSGVLEVGIMNEYKIHQRFFAKLKQKAEKKRKDFEDNTKMENKENIQKEKSRNSPEPPPRKRSVPPLEEKAADKTTSEAVDLLETTTELNGISSGDEERTPPEDEAPSEEGSATKRIKMSNSLDTEANSSSRRRSQTTGSVSENCYDGGLSLAQFLSETLQSQAAEENQNTPQTEIPKDMDTAAAVNVNKENEREQDKLCKKREEQEKALQEEHEKEKSRQEELSKDRERTLEMLHTTLHGKHGSSVKHHSRSQKDHDHHNIQASISSMFHSVKDFFFGKSKKESHDHTEHEEREIDHPVQPPEPQMPPSFQLQMDHNIETPLTVEPSPMEIDKPKEPSQTEAIVQQLIPVEPHIKCEDNVVVTLPLPTHELPPVNREDLTEKSAVVDDDVVEARDVSECLESTEQTASEEITSSGLDHHTEVVEKWPPVNQQEPDSPQPNFLVIEDKPSPNTDRSVLPQTKAPAVEETGLSECWTLPHSPILKTDSHSLGVVSTETLQEEDTSVDKVDKEDKPDKDEALNLNKLYEEEKVEVKPSIQPFSEINGYEIAELPAYSLEDRTEQRKSKTPHQVLSSVSTLEACSTEDHREKEEIKYTSSFQEVNVGLLPTSAPEVLDGSDLKRQHEPTPLRAGEIREGDKVSGTQSSNAGFKNSGDESESKEVLNYVIEKDLESNLCNSLKTQEQAISEDEISRATNESLQLEMDIEKSEMMNKGAVIEPNILLMTQNNEGNALEEQSSTAYKDNAESSWSKEDGWPSKNIPPVQISTFEDIPELKQTLPGLSPSEQFIIQKTEIMKADLKEATLPLTILALDKPETTNLQKHDATHVSGLFPSQKSIQNNVTKSSPEKVKGVAHLNNKMENVEQQQQPEESTEELSQLDHAVIPVINVSFTDDKEGDAFANSHALHAQQAFETPRMPLFVVPPISVTCHESEPEIVLPTHSERTENETSASMLKKTKQDVDSNDSAKPVKTPDVEELLEKSIKENTSTILYEALKPKVGENVQSLSKTTVDAIVPEVSKSKPMKDVKIEQSVEDLQKNRFSVDRLCSKPPTSPASLRKLMSKATTDSDNDAASTEDVSGGSTPTSSLSCESSPRMKRRDSLTLIRSATPEELASGARRKIFMPRPKEDLELSEDTPYMSPSQARRAAFLQAQKTPPIERRSPLMNRRKATLEVPKVVEGVPAEEPTSTKREEKPAEKKKDPLKAPQVIRKIRGEPFPDASGHLKLWCQFFNVLSDSTIKWFRDEEEILEIKRSGGDESQVALAIVLACSQDCGVYGCTITNEYGTDTTDFLLSVDILSEILLKDDLEVGEEIEMTPLLFTKGLADSGSWGEKYFGRIMTETLHIGEGCAHKASKVKVIYGLDPVFESGSTCIMKVRNPIPYGTKQESNLAERNLEITKQECKVQDMIREYCKIFSAEARINENFGSLVEVIPRYLMYRPANSVPYATVEADLTGVFAKYCTMDPKSKLIAHTTSEVEQKCCTFQHWIHQWTHGNLLVTQLEGVETKITNVQVVTKSKGYQGLTEYGSPEVFEQFLTHHQCNYFCGLLGLRPLKTMDSLQQTSKSKGSKSPLLNRRLSVSSTQPQQKSPQMSRKANTSPKVTRKVQETEDNKSDVKPKPEEGLDVLEMR
ncbi:alpha-protein kinase 3 [Pholidichthys leucotaenia]